jgi:hypothetical protein
LSTFIFPPPVAYSPGTEFLFRFVQFLIAAVIGLMILPMRKYAEQKHAVLWWSIAIVTLLLSVVIFINYKGNVDQYTIRFPFKTENKAVIGKELTQLGLSSKNEIEKENGKITNEELVANFSLGSEDQFDTIWKKEGVDSNRSKILWLYVSSVLSFTFFVIVMVQSIKCLDSRKRVSKPKP